MTTTELDEIDRAALERALALVRAESEQERERVDRELIEQGWQQAAELAAYQCQCRTMRLRPWQAPPIDASDEFGVGYGCQPSEVQLRRRLLAAGLSIYEPDPLTALERGGTCPG
jgi:hypothetical protein